MPPPARGRPPPPQPRNSASLTYASRSPLPTPRLRWSLLKRVKASTAFTPLTSIASPATGALPNSHGESLGHLCSAFIANGTPPPPINQAAQSLLEQQVDSWSAPANPSIPPHPSDAWAFSQADVKAQCTRQYINTAPGPDAILPAFLRHGGPALWKAMAAIYTFSWQHSVTPQAWREANVMALYKGSGSKATAGSYRPISMTSILIRTFEHLIHRRLAAELEGRNFFAPYQFGFRAGYSTTDAIHFLLTSIQNSLRTQRAGDGIQCPVLFLDIQKAFDRVDHAILLHRVKDAGITGKAWLWLRSFLSNRRMRCVDASETSAWQQVQYGVPQGCVLSPLLFLIFINQLQLTILGDPNCSHVAPLFYADDGTIGPNPFDRSPPPALRFEAEYTPHLKAAMVHLDDWCKTSRMRFGAEKSQLVVFTQRKTVDPTPFNNLQLCGFTVGIASSYKYLGLILTSRLRWRHAFDHALKEARLASSYIIRVAMASTAPSFTAIRLFVLNYVLPSFSYGILFWGRSHELKAARRTSLQAQLVTPLRVCLSLPRTTHQLGTLTLCQVPTVGALVAKAQLSHLARVDALPAMHPTRRLHAASLSHFTRRPTLRPHTALVPSSLLPCPSTSPPAPCRTSPSTPPSAAASTPPPSAPPHCLPAPTTSVGCSSGSTRAASAAPGRKPTTRSPSSAPPSHGPSKPRRASPAERSSRSPASIPTGNGKPRTPPTTPPRCSSPSPTRPTAPLTHCMPTPSLPPFLAPKSAETHDQQVTRARLALGRARTGCVRLRFAKAAEASTINPPLHPLLDAGQARAGEHPPHADGMPPPHRRPGTVAGLAGRSQPACHAIPLTLSMLLAVRPPPPPFRPSSLPAFLHATSAFLSAIHADRAKEQLLPLDTG